MATTNDEVRGDIDAVDSAMTSLRNSEMDLTPDPEETLEAWEGVFSAAHALEAAAEALVASVRVCLRTAENARDEAEG